MDQISEALKPHTVALGSQIGKSGDQVIRLLSALLAETRQNTQAVEETGRANFRSKWDYYTIPSAVVTAADFSRVVVVPKNEIFAVQAIILNGPGSVILATDGGQARGAMTVPASGGGGQTSGSAGEAGTPAAGTVITSQNLAAGTYTINALTAIEGAAGTNSDAVNMGLYIGATLVATMFSGVQSENGAPTPNGPFTITVPAGGATVAIKAIATTVNATTYIASLNATLNGNLGADTKTIGGDIAWLPGEHIMVTTTSAAGGAVAVIRERIFTSPKMVIPSSSGESYTGRDNTHDPARDNLDQRGVYTEIPGEVRASEGIEYGSASPSGTYDDTLDPTT